MKRSVMFQILALSLILLSSTAWSADLLSTNDMGTNVQKYEWLITGTATELFYANNSDDLDGDNKACGIRFDGSTNDERKGSLTLVMKVDAKPDEAFTNIKATADCWAYSSWGSSASLSLSTDGVNFDVVDNTASGIDTGMEVDATGVAGYNTVPSIWIRIEINDNYGYDYDPSYLRVENIRLEGDTTSLLLTNNDFGTTKQQAALIFSGTASEGFYANNADDLDGDTLACGLRFDGADSVARRGALDAIIRVDAPIGKVFNNIKATADCWAYAPWGSCAGLQLSKDGITFDVIGDTATGGTTVLEADASDVSGYEDLTSVWLKISMSDSWGFDISGNYLRVENVKFEGELSPYLLTTNDFGTTTQQDAWTITGTADELFYANNSDDLDGDTLACGIRFDGDTNTERQGNLTLILKVDAPDGKLFTNIKATADAWGFQSWGSKAQLELSKDGTNFDVVGSNTGYDCTTKLLVDSTGVSGYENLASVWLKIYMQDNYGFDINGAYLLVENVRLEGGLVTKPREPLTFKESGLYGGAGNYFLSDDIPFDFFIVQAVAYNGDTESHIEWNDWLELARRKDKRIIADLIPQAKNDTGNWYGLSSDDNLDTDDLDALVDVIGEFFDYVDTANLYGITLGEEHIFWNDHKERLIYVYEQVTANHDVPVFQWWSPSSTGSIPGIKWPNISADGWIADEYFADAPDFEKGMRGYTVLQKPFTQIIWAGGDSNSVDFYDTRFYAQYDICEKYNIPTSYFCYEGTGSAWGWTDNANDTLSARFDMVLAACYEADGYTGPDTSTWDSVTWSIPTLSCTETISGSPISNYNEIYTVERIVTVVNDTEIDTFAELHWDSDSLELRSHQPGAAEATVTYTFDSPDVIERLVVNATGYTNSSCSGTAIMSIIEGTTVIDTAALDAQGEWNFCIDGSNFSGQEFKVALDLGGTAQAAGDTLAGIDSINVNTITLPVAGTYDFGTTTQQNAWTITGTATELFVEDNLSDLDGDGDACELRFAGSTNAERSGNLTLILKVDAPSGQTFSNMIATADAWAFSSWGSSARLELSNDGTNWDVVGNTATGGYTVLDADSTDESGYDDLSSIWLKVYMNDAYGFDINNAHLWVKNIVLSGDVE